MPVKYDKGKKHRIWYRKRPKEVFLINQRLSHLEATTGFAFTLSVVRKQEM